MDIDKTHNDLKARPANDATICYTRSKESKQSCSKAPDHYTRTQKKNTQQPTQALHSVLAVFFMMCQFCFMICY